MGPKMKTYICNHCGRTFTDAGKWMSHDCDAPEQSKGSLTQRSARVAAFNASDVWAAMDVSFGEWIAQRQGGTA